MGTENRESCSQRDSAERKGYGRAHRSFNRIWKERDSAEPEILGKILDKDMQSLRGLNDQSRLLKIEELETAIEKNREQKQVLTNLMASGYLEPALFNKESNELAAEAESLRQEKDGLMRSVNGDMVKIEELQRLLRFTSKGTMMTEFDDEIFLSFVERITVLSRKEVVYEWKCGLSLKERLVEP